MATVQANQGVPWKSRLQGPSYFRRQSAQPRVRNQYIRTRTNIPGGGSRTVTTHYEAPSASQQARNRRSIRDLSPTGAGEKVTGSVGVLEGEFILCLGLLVLLMFANSMSSYGEKIMSLMKRGTLVCLLFFLLAIISQVGQNAERIAKAFGALVVIAILLTTPITTVITDVDNIIKNDWVGTPETGGDQASADSATAAANSSAVSDALQQTFNFNPLLAPVAALLPSSVIQKLGTAGDAIGNFLKGFGI